MQVNIFLKFILGLVVFNTINANIGFMERATSGMITLVLAIISALLPLAVMVLSAVGLILLHFNELGLAIVIITVVVFLMLYIFYFRFTPGRTWVILFVPLAFYFNVPFVIPVVFGLLSTPVMVVPAMAGTVVFYLLSFVQHMQAMLYAEGGLDYVQGAEVLYNGEEGLVDGLVENLEYIVEFITVILTNHEQWLMAFILGIGVLLVYAVRTRSFMHCWKVAYIGYIMWFLFAVRFVGGTMEIYIPSDIMWRSAIVALILGVVLEFMFFKVDYSKTQYMQFDDNDYYYYVKAIPKDFVNERPRGPRRQMDRPGDRGDRPDDRMGDRPGDRMGDRPGDRPGEPPRRDKAPRGAGMPPRAGVPPRGASPLKGNLDNIHPDKNGQHNLQETTVINPDSLKQGEVLPKGSKRGLPKASQIRAETENILLNSSLNKELGISSPSYGDNKEPIDVDKLLEEASGERPVESKAGRGKSSDRKRPRGKR